MQYLVTLKLTPPSNTLRDVLSLPGFANVEVDSSYGLVILSPKRGLYAIRISGNVDREALMAIPEVQGVHGDVRIAPIDPTSTNSES